MSEEKNVQSEHQSDDEFLAEVTDELIDAPLVAETENPEAESPQTEVTDNDDNKAQADSSESEREKLPEAVQEKIDKRIAKITAKSKQKEAELQAELDEAKREVDELKDTDSPSSKKTPSVNGDLNAMTADELSNLDKEAREFIVWASKGPLEEGFEGQDENGETNFYSPEEIKEQYNYYQEKVMVDIPNAREAKAGLARKLDDLAQANPALQDDSSEEFRVFREIYTDPNFQAVKANHPDPVATAWEMTLGRMHSSPMSPPVGSVPQVPSTPPQVPLDPSPARPAPIGTTATSDPVLTEADFERAESGDLDGVVAKLLT